MRRLALALVVALVACAQAIGAAPSPGATTDGILARDGVTRYVALPAAGRTFVAAVATRGGTIARFTTIRGAFGVPVVAFDGTADGLSFDGGTLVLAERAAGTGLRARSRLAIVDTRGFRHRTLELRGDFAFDALSPNGRLLYLIERLSASDVRRYRVRTYDLLRGRLLQRVVADKRTQQTTMSGLPVTRATGRDGRWAYTFYAGGPHPFVHALDTARGQAVCLDVHGLRARDVWSVRLTVGRDGSRLFLRARGRTLAVLRAP
jgi:hypothetical protein